MEDRGVEPLTSCMPCKPVRVLSGHRERLVSTGKAACTAACTSDREINKAGEADTHTAGPLASLTADISKLSEADRKRLLAMLAASLGVDGA